MSSATVSSTPRRTSETVCVTRTVLPTLSPALQADVQAQSAHETYLRIGGAAWGRKNLVALQHVETIAELLYIFRMRCRSETP